MQSTLLTRTGTWTLAKEDHQKIAALQGFKPHECLILLSQWRFYRMSEHPPKGRLASLADTDNARCHRDCEGKRSTAPIENVRHVATSRHDMGIVKLCSVLQS